MRKLIIKFTIFFIPITGVYFLLSFIASKHFNTFNDYTLSIIDKHERVTKIESSKIFFAGGSNVAFGINSSRIEKEFDIPVVNLGLHAGFGLLFMLEELKHSVKEGDIVFLSIEYFLNLEGDYKLKKHTSQYFKEAEKYYDNDILANISLHIEDARRNIKKYFTENNFQMQEVNKNEVSIYSRKAFNEFGDVTAHLYKKSPPKIIGRTHHVYRYWDGIKALNEFYEYAKEKNVKVFYLFPNYPTSEYFKNELVINRLADDLSSDLEIEIINTPLDFVYDDSCLFDTVYHLDEIGREMRTTELIEILKCVNERNPFISKG